MTQLPANQPAQQTQGAIGQLRSTIVNVGRKAQTYRQRAARVAEVTGRSGAAFAYTDAALGAFETALRAAQGAMTQPPTDESTITATTAALDRAAAQCEETIVTWWHTVELYEESERFQQQITRAQQQTQAELDAMLPPAQQQALITARMALQHAGTDVQQARSALAQHEQSPPADRAAVGAWALERTRLQGELTAYTDLEHRARAQLAAVEQGIAQERHARWRAKMGDLQRQVELEQNGFRSQIADLQRQITEVQRKANDRIQAIGQEIQRWQSIQPN